MGFGYAGEPRPVGVVLFHATDFVTICPLTSDPTDAPLIRITVEPSLQNGLAAPSFLMVEEMLTKRRSQMREQIGHLEREHLDAPERWLILFPGLG